MIKVFCLSYKYTKRCLQKIVNITLSINRSLKIWIWIQNTYHRHTTSIFFIAKLIKYKSEFLNRKVKNIWCESSHGFLLPFKDTYEQYHVKEFVTSISFTLIHTFVECNRKKHLLCTNAPTYLSIFSNK